MRKMKPKFYVGQRVGFGPFYGTVTKIESERIYVTWDNGHTEEFNQIYE